MVRKPKFYLLRAADAPNYLLSGDRLSPFQAYLSPIVGVSMY
jgi:hypothetical protein